MTSALTHTIYRLIGADLFWAFAVHRAGTEGKGERVVTAEALSRDRTYNFSDSADVLGSVQAATTERVRRQLRGHIQRTHWHVLEREEFLRQYCRHRGHSYQHRLCQILRGAESVEQQLRGCHDSAQGQRSGRQTWVYQISPINRSPIPSFLAHVSSYYHPRYSFHWTTRHRRLRHDNRATRCPPPVSACNLCKRCVFAFQLACTRIPTARFNNRNHWINREFALLPRSWTAKQSH